MRSKTKIVVLHMKELIYTGLFILLGILFIVLLVIMFRPNKKAVATSSEAIYTPGVYTASLILNNSALDLEIVVDENTVTSIRFVNPDDAVTTMYPLMQPTLEDLAEQICQTQDPSSVKYPDENRNTASVLLKAIRS
ncbi:MAG: hypothetical protein J6P60_03050, partial [Lachnospiraceae bacterium]|nr:hypothetical protein [Lachnospiraceae bacterium]